MGFYNQEIYDILQGKLEEISSMAGGAVQGYGAPFPGPKKKKKPLYRGGQFIKEEQEIVTEVMDYLLGISVG